MRKGDKAVLSMIFLGGMINFLDRTVIGLLAPSIASDLQLDPSEMGLAFSIFAIGYTIFTFVGGWATDRFGPRIVLGISMIFWSILCGLTGAVTGLISLLVVRFAFGAWESPWTPASTAMLARVVPPNRFAGAFGLISAGQPIGGALAGPIIALSVAIAGWRGSFAVVALIGLCWAVFWWPATRHFREVPKPVQPSAQAQEDGDTQPRLIDVLRYPAIIA
ncbi:MAG: MFS transporter, partial [Alphaproteobacteria bacterium]|nr:MFS transporter [Alphaproteobacteria bacterium]